MAKQTIYKKRIQDHLNQLNVLIENRKKEIANTYLGEELKRMESKKDLIQSFI